MEHSKMLRFHEDEIILRQGSVTREMYKILSGKTAVYFNYGEPNEYLVGILSEQRCFGEISVLCGQPNIYTVVAIGETMLLRITEQEFGDFVSNNPKNAVDIMQTLANSLVTLSFNLNQLTSELMNRSEEDPEIADEITRKIKQYTTCDSNGAAFFTMRL